MDTHSPGVVYCAPGVLFCRRANYIVGVAPVMGTTAIGDSPMAGRYLSEKAVSSD